MAKESFNARSYERQLQRVEKGLDRIADNLLKNRPGQLRNLENQSNWLAKKLNQLQKSIETKIPDHFKQKQELQKLAEEYVKWNNILHDNINRLQYRIRLKRNPYEKWDKPIDFNDTNNQALLTEFENQLAKISEGIIEQRGSYEVQKLMAELQTQHREGKGVLSPKQWQFISQTFPSCKIDSISGQNPGYLFKIDLPGNQEKPTFLVVVDQKIIDLTQPVATDSPSAILATLEYVISGESDLPGQPLKDHEVQAVLELQKNDKYDYHVASKKLEVLKNRLQRLKIAETPLLAATRAATNALEEYLQRLIAAKSADLTESPETYKAFIAERLTTIEARIEGFSK